MTRFQVVTEQRQGETVYVLRDIQSGATARIVPALGANCLEVSLPPAPGDKPVALIDDIQFLAQAKAQPSRYGIPVLFPWPSGIPGGRFQFRGKTVDLNPAGESQSRHHGFANTNAWRVIRSDCDNTAAWLTCAIDSADCGAVAARFPSRCNLEMTWSLRPDRLDITMTARNTGPSAMPLGVGLHPYFTIPFGKKGSRADCKLAAAAGRQWDLDSTAKLPPGAPRPLRPFLPAPAFPVSTPGGSPLGDVSFNHVFEATPVAGAFPARASVIDEANNVRLNVSASGDFKTWVFFSPRDRSVISLEPWTLAANGFNLAASGMREAGLLELEPGQAWHGQVVINCDRPATAQPA